MTCDEIIDKLKKREFAPVYLLHGAEPFFIDLISNYIEENLLSADEKDMNQNVVYGKDSDGAQVELMARSFPFCSQYRVVMIKEAKDLKDVAKLANYAANPSPTTILVICYKYASAPKGLVDACKKSGVVFASASLREYEWTKFAIKQAESHKLRLAPDAASVLVEFIGNDLSRIDNELKKLRIHLPDDKNEITADIVKNNIGMTKEYNILELQNALGERNEAKVFKITLNFCQNQKDNPNVKTIATLAGFYTKLLAYHFVLDKSTEALKQLFGSTSDFYVNKLVSYAQRYAPAELKKNISVLREYDLKAKGLDFVASQEDLLKEMMYKLLH
ncbi:MAG: DNA polymerase III subunit delta [Bacteroidales bacterium]|nr:DNA polymerase III subunit delta [Bacteroidales bacterium]